MRVEIIRVDGTREEHELDRRTVFDDLDRLCGWGGDYTDTVNLRDGRVMLVADNGHRDGLPLNPEATNLYLGVCRPGTLHSIVGDVAICVDADFA